MTEALDTLRGRARVKRTMWSRRAQEYEAKINSGDPVQIAEVVRDLHRNAGQPDQSFSERQIYEQAMDRLAAELAAIDRTDKPAATEKLLHAPERGLTLRPPRRVTRRAVPRRPPAGTAAAAGTRRSAGAPRCRRTCRTAPAAR